MPAHPLARGDMKRIEYIHSKTVLGLKCSKTFWDIHPFGFIICPYRGSVTLLCVCTDEIVTYCHREGLGLVHLVIGKSSLGRLKEKLSKTQLMSLIHGNL